MKALLAGYGGIGSNVYYPELKKLGYDVDILDNIALEAKYKNISNIKDTYDLAVVCTPNFTHDEIANHLADRETKRIFVEKPGLINSETWDDLVQTYPDTQFHVVKNNLYRDNYGDVLRLMNEKIVIGVDINWFNDNRIPSPGSWFTNKELAFGGVSRDLMPHLYCFAIKLFGESEMQAAEIHHISYQRWDLENISSTDYGTVNKNGIYDVDDNAFVIGSVNGISLKMNASWKEGYDKQSITLFFDDGTNYEWSFGLCPAEAYGKMLQDTTDTYDMDMNLHSFLEKF